MVVNESRSGWMLWMILLVVAAVAGAAYLVYLTTTKATIRVRTTPVGVTVTVQERGDLRNLG